MLSFQPSSRVLSPIRGVAALHVRIFPLSSMVGTNVTVLVVVLPSGLVCNIKPSAIHGFTYHQTLPCYDKGESSPKTYNYTYFPSTASVYKIYTINT
jgi:hypothetical protein